MGIAHGRCRTQHPPGSWGRLETRTLRRRILAAVLLLGVSALFDAPALGECKVDKFAEFPVTVENSRPIMTAKINGHDVRLVVDSGMFFSTLSSTGATELGLQTHRAPRGFYLVGAGGQALKPEVTTVTLTLAGIPLRGVDFLVGGSESATDFVGFIGQNVLHINDVEYDLAGGAVRLIKADGCRKASLAYWATSSFQLDIEPTSHERFHTVGRAYVNGIEVSVLFDTGSPISTLSLKAAARAGVRPDSPGVMPAGTAHGLDRGSFETYVASFSSFKIGGEEIREPHLLIGDINLMGKDMLIGADFFLSHRIYVANSQSKLYFTDNGGAAAAAGPDADEGFKQQRAVP
jgi:predicted aspartyl protease